MTLCTNYQAILPVFEPRENVTS